MSWLCLVLLTAASCHGRPNWPSGVLENENVKLPQQNPVEVQRYLFEAQDAVKSLVEGAKEEALEHLAAMKRKHIEIIRKNFYNALEKRLFRLDSLKPQTTWHQKPCMGSVLSCFHIPKYYLSRPLNSKINYIIPQVNCNCLPHNSYLFQECIQRSLLSTHATVKPTSEIHYTTTVTSLVKSTDNQTNYEKEDISTKKIVQSSKSDNISEYFLVETTSLKPIKRVDNFEKLDSQNTSINLENEILGFEDYEKLHTSTKTFPTSTQTSFVHETESINTKYNPKSEMIYNARNDPEPSASSSQKYPSSTVPAMNGLDSLSSTMDFKYQDVIDQHITLPFPIPSTNINEPKENSQTGNSLELGVYKISSYPMPKTSTSTTPLSSNTFYTGIISQNKMQNEIERATTENVEQLKNVEIEEVYKDYTNYSPKPINLNEFDVTTQVPEIILGREEPQVVTLFPDESIIAKGITEKLITKTPQDIQPHILETTSSSWTTILNRYNDENNDIATSANSPNQNGEFIQQSTIDTTRIYISSEELVVTEMSETGNEHNKEKVALNPVNIEAASTTKSSEVDIALKTDEIELNTETITKIENNLIPEEDINTVNQIKQKQPFLDVQEKLLEQTLSYYSQTNFNYPSTTSFHNAPEYDRDFTTEQTTTGSNEFDHIAITLDELKLSEKENVTVITPDLEETPSETKTIDITTIDSGNKQSRIIDEIFKTTENFVVINTTPRYEVTSNNPLFVNISSRSPIIQMTKNSDNNQFVSRETDNALNGILKFTNEIESTTESEDVTSSTPADLTLNGEPHMLNSEKGQRLQREKRSENKRTKELEDSLEIKANTSDVYISPTQYASTILELLPVIREGYKNNAFSDEDKKVIRSIYGEMEPLLEGESLRNIKESATDLMMDEETLRTDGDGDYPDYDYSGSQDGVSAENERRLKRSKNLHLLSTLVGHLPKKLQKKSPPLMTQSRKIRSSGPQQVSEAAAILALLAENGEGVQLDRADDDDDDEYEYYEDYSEDDLGDEDLYEDEYDDNPSFTELIKLARKHRERKAMQ